MRKILLAVASSLLGWLAVCAGAGAQQIEGVDVSASRIVKEQVGTSRLQAPINAVSLSYRVSYADLDLGTKDGAAAFEKRVNEAALAACRQITQLYPDATPDDSACARRAVDEAMPAVRKAVEAAAKAR